MNERLMVLQPIGWITTLHEKPRLHCRQQWYWQNVTQNVR